MELAKKLKNAKLVKSFIRVVGYTMLFGIPSTFASAAACVLIVSELMGIYDELT